MFFAYVLWVMQSVYTLLLETMTAFCCADRYLKVCVSYPLGLCIWSVSEPLLAGYFWLVDQFQASSETEV